MVRDLIKPRLAERSLRFAKLQQRSLLADAAKAATSAYRNGQLPEAEAALDKIFRLDPMQPDAQLLKGVIDFDRGSLEAAEVFFSDAISERPTFPIAHYNLANVFRETGRFDLAIQSYQTAIDQAPEFYSAHGNLGLTYRLLGDDVNALDSLHKAIELKPDYTEALDNLGSLLRKQGRLVEACELYNKAVINDPGYASGYNNLGNTLRDLGQLDAAIRNYKRALKINPDQPEAHNNLGLIYLLTGEFSNGWQEYQWRHKIAGGPQIADHLRKPKWDGAAFAERTLYVYPEQGFGDVIQFSRYIPIVAKLGGRIIYRVSPKLFGLVDQIDGVDVVNSETEPEPEDYDYDYHISLMDLPRLLKTTVTTIPDTCPYLDTDTKLVTSWAKHFDKSHSLKIGLVWAGQPQHENDHNRSINPNLLRRLGEVPGASLYSLQVGKSGQAESVFGDTISDLSTNINTFSDTAAAMKNLDLIISADTATAHLAGAIGCPIWTLLPFTPDWRWLLGRADSPWYPTMTLIRQPVPGDWASVIDVVISRLTTLASEK